MSDVIEFNRRLGNPFGPTSVIVTGYLCTLLQINHGPFDSDQLYGTSGRWVCQVGLLFRHSTDVSPRQITIRRRKSLLGVSPVHPWAL